MRNIKNVESYVYNDTHLLNINNKGIKVMKSFIFLPLPLPILSYVRTSNSHIRIYFINEVCSETCACMRFFFGLSGERSRVLTQFTSLKFFSLRTFTSYSSLSILIISFFMADIYFIHRRYIVIPKIFHIRWSILLF